MEFIDDNLTKEDVRKTLELMKKGIEFYKSEHKNRRYIYDIGDKTISVNFYTSVIPHLLGYDINAKNTWFEYIGEKFRINSLEWLEEFVKSGEFIEYMIFSKKEPKLVNFSKIRFKSQHFCSINLRKNPAFLFKLNIGTSLVKHIGVPSDNKIITFKLVRGNSRGNSIKHYTCIPNSLYVYNDTNLDFEELTIPNKLIITGKRGYTDEKLESLYSPCNVEELKEKINQFKR